MSFSHTSKSEAEACLIAIDEVMLNGIRVKRAMEISPFALSIPFDPNRFSRFSESREGYGVALGEAGKSALRRTTRVYTSLKGRITKPSYRDRLENYPDVARRPVIRNSVNQIEKISDELAKYPRASTHSFVFLRPSDLFEKRWPGYVPCPIAGDFKFRDGKLDLNVMFRSCDVLNFLYSDIYYLRRLQIEVLEAAMLRQECKIPSLSSIGNLNLFLSRAFIQTWEIAEKGGIKGLLLRAESVLREIDGDLGRLPLNGQ